MIVSLGLDVVLTDCGGPYESMLLRLDCGGPYVSMLLMLVMLLLLLLPPLLLDLWYWLG